MNETARAAYILSQAACAMAELAAMKAEDALRHPDDHCGPHTGEEYRSVMDRYGIGHNAVVDYLRGCLDSAPLFRYALTVEAVG